MAAIQELQDRSPLSSIDRVTPDRVLTWANRPRLLTEYLRDQAGRYNIDAGTVVLGYALDVILGDDHFVPIVDRKFEDHLREQDPNAIRKAHTYQTTIMERLDWETSLPELPEGMREALGKVLDEVQQTDWVDPDDFQKAKKIEQEWVEVKAAISEAVEQDPQLANAYAYTGVVLPEIRMEFNGYINSLVKEGILKRAA